MRHLDIDETVTDWFVAHRSPAWTDAMHAITTVGNTLAMTAIALIATVGWAIRREPVRALTVLLGSVVGYVVMVGLKHLFGRDRPPAPIRLVDIDTYAFPSGHAMMSAIVLGLVAVTVCRSWMTMIAVVASALIGVSRVYLGVHWMTDVLAGWTFGALWVAGVSAVPAVRRAVRGARRPAASASATSRKAPPPTR
ncbi:phosphatase PAP2 family protein [Williamsia sterculiae]|uniref:Undecaprenyl-diphosphatase n=1 Tax=Williamsia sterculiae TaxID=1344003 RepID=A0A1N7GVQ2_9NOCA|nr:phosphatase PAP2 family protein [Williamsia sterculiae]SIS16665.1 undecaprenyl-diphosphatase [Williamsia sterculiae]